MTSRPSRGAWIEIYIIRYEMELKLSRPSRGAWIEILITSCFALLFLVAPLAGRVD